MHILFQFLLTVSGLDGPVCLKINFKEKLIFISPIVRTLVMRSFSNQGEVRCHVGDISEIS